MSIAVDDGSSPGRNSSAVNVTCLALWHTDRIDEKQRFLSVSSDENVIHECRKSQWSYYITVSTAPGHHHLNAREIRWWTVSTINVFFFKNHSAYLFLLMLSWAPLHSCLFLRQLIGVPWLLIGPRSVSDQNLIYVQAGALARAQHVKQNKLSCWKRGVLMWPPQSAAPRLLQL